MAALRIGRRVLNAVESHSFCPVLSVLLPKPIPTRSIHVNSHLAAGKRTEIQMNVKENAIKRNPAVLFYCVASFFFCLFIYIINYNIIIIIIIIIYIFFLLIIWLG